MEYLRRWQSGNWRVIYTGWFDPTFKLSGCQGSRFSVLHWPQHMESNDPSNTDSSSETYLEPAKSITVTDNYISNLHLGPFFCLF